MCQLSQGVEIVFSKVVRVDLLQFQPIVSGCILSATLDWSVNIGRNAQKTGERRDLVSPNWMVRPMRPSSPPCGRVVRKGTPNFSSENCGDSLWAKGMKWELKERRPVRRWRTGFWRSLEKRSSRRDKAVTSFCISRIRRNERRSHYHHHYHHHHHHRHHREETSHIVFNHQSLPVP